MLVRGVAERCLSKVLMIKGVDGKRGLLNKGVDDVRC